MSHNYGIQKENYKIPSKVYEIKKSHEYEQKHDNYEIKKRSSLSDKSDNYGKKM